MTEDQIKEAISKGFVRTLAESNGFKVNEPSQDHGVDLMIKHVAKRVLPSGSCRFVDSQFSLDLQLKSTTESGVIDGVDDIRYDLEVKNYNDLVFRRSDPLPLYLVLVVLRYDPPTCITINDRELSLLGRAYWYIPDAAATATENQSTIRITIPKNNLLSLSFVRDRFEEVGVEI